MSQEQTRRERFLTSHSGKELLKLNSLKDSGFWKVLGADNNPDLHGAHYQPDLGTFEGILEDIVEYAVTLPGFWDWSSGDICKVPRPMKITAHSNFQRLKLVTELAELQSKMNAIQLKLTEINNND